MMGGIVGSIIMGYVTALRSTGYIWKVQNKYNYN